VARCEEKQMAWRMGRELRPGAAPHPSRLLEHLSSQMPLSGWGAENVPDILVLLCAKETGEK